MDVWDAPVRDVRPLLTAGRAELVAVLAPLAAEDWAAPTEVGHWRVGDVARHLLGGDLGLLARWRDGDPTGLIPVGGGHEAFVAALDAANERWVTALAGLSAAVVADLLDSSGAALDAFLATVDLRSPRHVGWSGGDAPAWLDIAREHTERWVHGRHVTDALGAPPAPGVEEVLRTFVWAFPARFAPAPDGTTVAVALGPDRWTLVRTAGAWALTDGPPSGSPATGSPASGSPASGSPGSGSPAATLALGAEPAWRHLTGLPVPDGAVRTTGDPALVASLLAVRSIIV